MFSSINTGLSGLMGFSEGLDVLSNNISNMNSPGFKASQLIFRDLFYQYTNQGNSSNGGLGTVLGQGVSTGPTTIQFKQGDLRDTGNTLDTAINGDGFFILRQDDKTFYTRAGQFQFDQNGYLVDSASGARLAAIQSGVLLQDISIDSLRVNPAHATTKIDFTNILATGNSPYTLPGGATVYDNYGKDYNLTVTFTATVASSWTVEVKDSAGSIVTTGQISFDGAGTPAAGGNTLAFTYSPDANTSLNITFNFGDPGSTSGVTSYSGATSTLAVKSQDGYASGALVETKFDEMGYLSLKYSNNQTVKGSRLALAWFDNLAMLSPVGHSSFENSYNQTVQISSPGENVMGKLVSGKIELSNVQLTEQFTDMVVIQRGFQASSQIISVSNELMQTLLDLHSKR